MRHLLHALQTFFIHLKKNTCHCRTQVVIAHGKTKVLLMALQADADIVNDWCRRSRFLGKLSGFSPITLYLPLFHSWISTPKSCHMVKSMADLKYFLMNQSRILAGIHTLPFSLGLYFSCTFITFRDRVATTVNLFFCISNKKFSISVILCSRWSPRWYAALF